VALVEFEVLAVGDLDLLLDQIDAGDLLGDGVLHLDAGVHLDEVEVTLGVHEVFDGAGAFVVAGLGGLDRGLAHALAQVGREEGRGGFLDELLVAALHGAVAFAEVEGLAVGVGEDLELDVAGLLDVFLDIDRAVAEGFLGLVAGDVVFLGEGDVVVGDAHAAPAAAGDGLDDDGVADLAGDFDGFGLAGDGAVGAGDGGHAGFFDGVLGHGLVAHDHDGLGLGADELDVARLALLGELGVLGEKTVAGVDGIDVGEFGGGDDAVGAQVALGAFGGADADGLVGELHVERLGVGLGIDREGFDAEFAAGAHDA